MNYHTPDTRDDRPATIKSDMLRRSWVRPVLSRMKAGDAELGSNPDNADGAFTFS